MENNSNNKFDSIYSNKVKAGKRRTYFFDVRQTKGDDYFISMTESTRRYDGNGYERHKIFLYKEDFNKFIDSLQETIDYVKDNLMPNFDYDSFSNEYHEDEDNGGYDDSSEDSGVHSEDDMEW